MFQRDSGHRKSPIGAFHLSLGCGSAAPEIILHIHVKINSYRSLSFLRLNQFIRHHVKKDSERFSVCNALCYSLTTSQRLKIGLD